MVYLFQLCTRDTDLRARVALIFCEALVTAYELNRVQKVVKDPVHTDISKLYP